MWTCWSTVGSTSSIRSAGNQLDAQMDSEDRSSHFSSWTFWTQSVYSSLDSTTRRGRTASSATATRGTR
eukprot:6163824-Pleurochrysis_carterae.AAC.1